MNVGTNEENSAEVYMYITSKIIFPPFLKSKFFPLGGCVVEPEPPFLSGAVKKGAAPAHVKRKEIYKNFNNNVK